MNTRQELQRMVANLSSEVETTRHANLRQGVEIGRLRLMLSLLEQGITYEMHDGDTLWRFSCQEPGCVASCWSLDGGKTIFPTPEHAIRAKMGWGPLPRITETSAAVIAIEAIKVAFATEGICSDEVIDLINGVLERYQMATLGAG